MKLYQFLVLADESGSYQEEIAALRWALQASAEMLNDANPLMTAKLETELAKIVEQYGMDSK